MDFVRLFISFFLSLFHTKSCGAPDLLPTCESWPRPKGASAPTVEDERRLQPENKSLASLFAEPAGDFGGFVSLPRKKRHNLVNIMGWDYTFRSKRQILSREMAKWAKSNKKIPVTDGDALRSLLRESTGESRS